MINYKAERDASIRKILRYVCEYRNIPQYAYTPDFADIVKECIDLGYLENVTAVKVMSGHIRLTAARPFVTKEGLAFLFAETSQDANNRNDSTHVESIAAELKRMNDDMRQNHAEDESKTTKERRFQILNTVLSAILGALFTMAVEHFPEIIEFFRNIFQ